MSLSHSPEDIIRYLLTDLGLGTVPSASGDWPVYATQEPDTPDNVITVYGTEGVKHGRDFVESKMDEHFGIQIRIRATSPTVGHVKANAIATALDVTAYQDSVTIGSSVYFVHSVNRKNGPLNLGKEPGSRRHLFTINALTTLRQTT